jgi:hypothetical protein
MRPTALAAPALAAPTLTWGGAGEWRAGGRRDVAPRPERLR